MNIIAQCCGIILLIIIMYSYHTQDKIRLNTAKAFVSVCNVTLGSLILDIAAAVMIAHCEKLPLRLVEIVCKLYVASLVWVVMYILRYAIVDIYQVSEVSRKKLKLCQIVAICDSLLIYVLPLQVFDEGNQAVHTYGPSVLTTYIMMVGIVIALATIMIAQKTEMTPRRRNAIAAWLGLWILAAVVEFFNGQLLLVGFANTVGILVIYLRLENPEMNLDRDTGLFNMSAFSQYIRQLHGKESHVSIIDLIYTSGSDSSMSYETQQNVKQQVADFLGTFPETMVFRVSSDEYLLVIEDEELARQHIKTLEARFSEPWGQEYLRMIPIDWVFIPTTSILNQAEDIMPVLRYAKQHKGLRERDHGTIVDTSMIEALYEEREIENEIIMALQEDRVEVFYQPIYSVKDDLFHSAEALARIRDENGNIVPPGRFIHVAEEKGLIIRLGELVFDKVCRFISEEKPYEYGLQYVEVNLSVIQCAYEHLADDFIEIMRHFELDPKYIVLEITESESIKDKETLLENMRKLKEVGVRFALDDFGTGQSNLNYIVDMPVDVVKFDSTMTNAYFANGTAKYVMDAAMHMIQGMDLQIVSEGIEEHDQYKTMADLGIDFVQGYYFSKPIEEANFLSFIKEKHMEQLSD